MYALAYIQRAIRKWQKERICRTDTLPKSILIWSPFFSWTLVLYWNIPSTTYIYTYRYINNTEFALFSLVEKRKQSTYSVSMLLLCAHSLFYTRVFVYKNRTTIKILFIYKTSTCFFALTVIKIVQCLSFSTWQYQTTYQDNVWYHYMVITSVQKTYHSFALHSFSSKFCLYSHTTTNVHKKRAKTQNIKTSAEKLYVFCLRVSIRPSFDSLKHQPLCLHVCTYRQRVLSCSHHYKEKQEKQRSKNHYCVLYKSRWQVIFVLWFVFVWIKIYRCVPAPHTHTPCHLYSALG